MEIDPVCGMKVDPAKALAKFDHAGRTYYFCCAGCAQKFQSTPQLYLQPKPSTPTLPLAVISPTTAASPLPVISPHLPSEPASAPKPPASAEDGIEYTCPMDPQIVTRKPGACPICGMALEPRIVAAEEEPSEELTNMRRRFWISVALTTPILLIAMLPLSSWLGAARLSQFYNWVELALATPVVLWGGWPFFVRGWRSIVSHHLNMFTLIALGTGTAFLYSIFATLAPDIFPAAFRRPNGEVGVYFEAAAVITTLVLLGQFLEIRARRQTSTAIRALLGLSPKTARRITPSGEENDVPLSEIMRGDRLRVRPGERVPTDGVVLQGTSSLDESMISGESLPLEKHEGDAVTGGTLNGSGSFIMRAERVGAETLLAQIVRLVGEAQRSRAPIQRLADTVSAYFVPAVMFISVITFIVWSLVGPQPRLAYALVNAVAVLIVACPCALGLATPMAVMVGVGRGAAAGVLVRNAESLETLENVDTLVIDKTGTLTEGKPKVASLRLSANAPIQSEEELLGIAAALERSSEHPLASAILKAASERKLAPLDAQQFRALPGRGLTGVVSGRAAALGNEALLRELGIDLGEIANQAQRARAEGDAVIFVAVDSRAAGWISVSDPIKPSASEAIRELRVQGLNVVMLTGDHRRTAEAVARKLGIDQVEAEVLPNRKAEVVKRLQSKGRHVAMAGDGINDAPALAQAQVGIAMGTGTDIAMQTAGITLVRGDLRGIVRAARLSRKTMRNIRQNLFFAFIYNAVGVPIAAGVLYPVFGLLLSPMIASLAMSFSSVSVISNALRLRHTAL